MRLSRLARIAAALWLTLGATIWNVVFDRTVVLAGRRYVYAAALSVQRDRTYLRTEDWMQPEIARGVWLASAAGGVIAAVGLAAVFLAARHERRHQGPRGL